MSAAHRIRDPRYLLVYNFDVYDLHKLEVLGQGVFRVDMVYQTNIQQLLTSGEACTLIDSLVIQDMPETIGNMLAFSYVCTINIRMTPNFQQSFLRGAV